MGCPCAESEANAGLTVDPYHRAPSSARVSIQSREEATHMSTNASRNHEPKVICTSPGFATRQLIPPSRGIRFVKAHASPEIVRGLVDDSKSVHGNKFRREHTG
ncbi:hypothetical protein JDV02_006396 [Purpureocillium takamizusanense]|uniref:Uncharacterized protein n=1 Tax=Purpureocillium takamizusanense TaxID=2060973 RepID=A0A9Q8QK52_9HYPO|nr:uncharacterized protein JDV02_006396 [Purpureocillium takamizusanense]UNI20296.1 hypothetical protein JDV02_006396 [Purpureocillium takamizusanense]